MDNELLTQNSIIKTQPITLHILPQLTCEMQCSKRFQHLIGVMARTNPISTLRTWTQLACQRRQFSINPFNPCVRVIYGYGSVQECRCEGCNSRLQHSDRKKYGYIDQEGFSKAVETNKQLINETYGAKANNKDAKILDLLHEVEKQTQTTIFNPNKAQLENLDNVQILLKMQQKIDRYQQGQQTLHRSKKSRKDILCYRCYTLKHHNRLPDQYDDAGMTSIGDFTEQRIMAKVIAKHQTHEVLYLYMLDALDIFGTFRPTIVKQIIEQSKRSLAIVINKADVVNDKYLNEHLLRKRVRDMLFEVVKHNQLQERIAVQQVKVFFVSGLKSHGVTALKQYVVESHTRVQLVGLPNTGKTTLMNALIKTRKTTSKYPGTTLKITENEYKKKLRLFDMPGIHIEGMMYNLIVKPSERGLLTWNKFFSPGLLTHRALFFGGKVEIEGIRIVVFGLGGACSSDHRWFLLNYRQFWKGLPPLNELNIKKYEQELEFKDGVAMDLEIAGYGFIGFRLCQPNIPKATKKLTFYLPEGVAFNFRESVLNDSKIFHNRSALTNRFMLQRIHQT